MSSTANGGTQVNLPHIDVCEAIEPCCTLDENNMGPRSLLAFLPSNPWLRTPSAQEDFILREYIQFSDPAQTSNNSLRLASQHDILESIPLLAIAKMDLGIQLVSTECQPCPTHQRTVCDRASIIAVV